MAGRSDIQAGAAYIRLYIRDSAFIKGLAQIKAGLITIGSAALKLGTILSGAVTAGLLASVKHFAETGDQIAKMSARTGVGTNALSELGYAAGQSGSSIEELEGGIRKMQKTVDEARRGNEGAKESLALLGVTLDQLAGKRPEEQLEIMADALTAIEDPARRTAAIMGIFGKTGTNLIPLLAGGSAGIRALRQEAIGLGQSIDPEDAANAEKLGDAWDRLKKIVAGVTFRIGAALAEDLIAGMEVVEQFLGIFSEGGFKLAGEIAMSSMQVALLEGMNVIAGIFGDTVGKIGTDIIQGNLVGAWNTALLGMATVFDDFVVGLIGAFTVGATKITNLWESTTQAIAGFLIEIDRTGPNLLGLDAEQLRADKLNAALGLKNEDVTAQAKAAASGNVTATADRVRASLAATFAAADAKAADTASEFERAVAGGADLAKEARDEAKAELDALIGRSAAKRGKGGLRPGPGVVEDAAAVARVASTVTFSGAALAAAGQGGGGPQDKLLAETKAARGIADETLDATKRLKAAVERVATGMVMA